MPDKKLTDVTDNNVGKMSDSEIVKAIPLKKRIEHYNERLKEVFESYYRRNTKGAEEPLEICVLRDSAILIQKLEDLINRLQAENEKLKEEKSKLENKIDEIYPLVMQLPNAMQQAKAEAYKECIEKVKEISKYETYCDNRLPAPIITYHITKDTLDNLLKELVGEDK